VTYGTVAYGFFRDSEEFRRKMHYWHILPASMELGFRCPEDKPAAESTDAYLQGLQVQEQLLSADIAGRKRTQAVLECSGTVSPQLSTRPGGPVWNDRIRPEDFRRSPAGSGQP